MKSPTFRYAIGFVAVAAAGVLAAGCADQATGPGEFSAVDGRLQAASTSHLPKRIANSVKYRDSGHKPATGRAGSAQLSVRALLGKDGLTTLEVTTGQLDDPRGAPGNIAKLQIKAFDPDGGEQYTRNLNNLNAGGYITQVLPGHTRGSRLQVQANVEGIDFRRTGVVTVAETVMLRPDLQASNLVAPTTATVLTPVNLSATVSEINGDVGARADCVLYVDGAEVDRANRIWVDAGGVVSCAFTHAFRSTGTKQLEVRVENVTPADFDLANNTVVGSIETVSGSESVSDFFYYAAASDVTFENQSEGEGWWEDSHARGEWTTRYGNSGRDQYAYMSADMVREVSFPITRLEVSQATGGTAVYSQTLHDIEADWSESYEDPWYGYGYRESCLSRAEMDDGWRVVAWMHLCSGSYTYGSETYPFTWFNTGRYGGSVTYHSQSYSRVWYRDTGEEDTYTWNDTWQDEFGTLISYGSDYRFNLSLQDGAAQYRAAPTVLLEPFDHRWESDRYCWGDSWEDYSFESCWSDRSFYTGVIGSTYFWGY